MTIFYAYTNRIPKWLVSVRTRRLFMAVRPLREFLFLWEVVSWDFCLMLNGTTV